MTSEQEGEKNMKKIGVFLLAMLMCITVFAGCASQGESSTAGDSQSDSSSQSQSESGAQNGEKTEFIVGLDVSFPPMGFMSEDNEIVGFDIDMAKEVAKKLGLELKLQPIDWAAKEMELNNGNIDCIWNGMTMTEELKPNMDFSVAYSGNMQVCVINVANKDKYTSLQDMVDAKIVAEAGSAGAAAVEGAEELKNATLTTLTAQRDTLLELKSGTADVAVIDGVMAKASVGEGTDFADLMIVPNVELTKEEYGIGFRKDSDLTQKVNDALQQLTEEGVVEEIEAKYPSVLVTLGQ